MYPQPMTTQRFEVPYHDYALIGDVNLPQRGPFGAGQTPTILMLHGAGHSYRGRYEPVQDRLAAAGIASAVFDMVGHGDTGGELAESSLVDRTNQAIAVIEHLQMEQPFGLIGGSMGAYTALKLTERYTVDKLVLIVPGVYAADVYTMQFNAGFSQRMREPESWRATDAWAIMEKFQGDVLIITAENDEVVPPKIPHTLYDHATHAHSRSMYEIPGAPHRFVDYLGEPAHVDLLNSYLTRIEQCFI